MITKEKWQSLSLAQQLGNIGSELSRARHSEEQKDMKAKADSLARSLELLDMSLDDSRWRKKYKEIARLREVVSAWIAESPVYDIRPIELENYCISLTLNPYNI